MKRTAIAAGLVAGLTAGGLAGITIAAPVISGAQTETTTPDTTAPATQTPDSTTPDADEDADRPERGEWLADAIAPLVEDGTITQAQADAVIAAIDEAKPDRGVQGFGRGRGLDSAATAIGITVEEFRTALRDGQTIAEVAEANGVAVDAVVTAMVADIETHLAEEVAEGDLTQAEADEKLAGATERVTALVNGELEMGGRGGFGGGRGPWGGGDDAD
jgi:hypothetical protein